MKLSPADLAALDHWLQALAAHIERMDRCDRAPAMSFPAEFDALQRIDRDAMRAAQDEFAASLAPENALRNRYPNILCNERSRWRAPAPSSAVGFINANCIDGLGDSRGYIATQAPPPATMPAFWAMVYEERSPVIVTLNRPQEVAAYVPKCDRYWPLPEEACAMGTHYVQASTVTELGPIVVRRFTVGELAPAERAAPPPAGAWDQTPVRGAQGAAGPQPADPDDLRRLGEPHHVVQLQYTEWPDQAVPEHPHGMLRLCALVDELLDAAPAAGRPIVHCSAGVGRTGTFISVHKLLNAVYAAHPLSGGRGPPVPKVGAVVAALKTQRSKSVQTAEQYRFIFVALLQGAKSHRDAIANALPS